MFIATILPRKFDQSATHELVKFSKEFVLDQLAIIDALFAEEGKSVNTFTSSPPDMQGFYQLFTAVFHVFGFHLV